MAVVVAEAPLMEEPAGLVWTALVVQTNQLVPGPRRQSLPVGPLSLLEAGPSNEEGMIPNYMAHLCQHLLFPVLMQRIIIIT